MIKALVTDVSRVLLFPKDRQYTGSLNVLHKTVSRDPKFNFWEHFELNEELLAFYKSLQPGLKIYILTSDAIQDDPTLVPFWSGVVERIFSASKMGVRKNEVEAYLQVLNNINLPANEVLYIDDIQENLEAAKKVGMATVLYRGNEQVIAGIQQFL